MATHDTLKAKKEIANQLVNKIQEITKEAETLNDRIQQLNLSTTGKSKELRSTINKLNRLKRTASESIDSFKIKKDKIGLLLSQTNSFYTKRFLPLKEKIENPETGLRKNLTQSEKLKNEIQKVSEYCKDRYDEIRNNTNEFRKQITQLRHIIKTIEELESKSTKGSISIEEIRKNVSEIENNISLLIKNITEEFNKSVHTNKEITELKNSSEKALSDINEVKQESQDRLRSIQDIYEIAHQTGLSGEFERRRNQHKTEKEKWRKWVLGSSLVLFVGLIVLYFFQLVINDWNLDATFDLNFYIRFVLLSPIVYYLIFSSNQYQKERALFDKYSFKTTLAMSIKQHIELLVSFERFKSEQSTESIIEFIMDGFEKIYKEPYDDDYKLKLKMDDIELNLVKKLLEKLGLKTELEKS